jgi:dolichol kinase
MQKIRWARRLWHLTGVPIALIYWLCFAPEGRTTAVLICLPFTAVFLGLDVAKWRSQHVRDWILGRLGAIASPRDLKNLNSSSWYMLGCTLTIALFDAPAAVTGILILAVADNAASIIGQLWGRHRIGDKSIEGTAAFFLVGWLVGLPFGSAVAALGAALFSGLAELFIPRIDDNFIIPPLAATGFWLASYL